MVRYDSQNQKKQDQLWIEACLQVRGVILDGVGNLFVLI